MDAIQEVRLRLRSVNLTAGVLPSIKLLISRLINEGVTGCIAIARSVVSVCLAKLPLSTDLARGLDYGRKRGLLTHLRLSA